MSRSRRHTPICGHTIVGFTHGEQWFKRQAWHRVRRAVKMRLLAVRVRRLHVARWGFEWPETPLLPTLRELSNPWGMPKDGKQWFGDCREDARVWRRCMTK